MGRKVANSVLWGLALTLCSYVLMNSLAKACRMTSPVTKEMALDADTVIQGVVVGYEVITTDRGPVAHIKLKVTKTYRGAPQSARSLQLLPTTGYWLPGDLAAFKRKYGDVIVAGLDTTTSSRFTVMWDAYLREQAEKSEGGENASSVRVGDLWKVPFVVQEPCNKPLLGSKAELEPELRRLGIVE